MSEESNGFDTIYYSLSLDEQHTLNVAALWQSNTVGIPFTKLYGVLVAVKESEETVRSLIDRGILTVGISDGTRFVRQEGGDRLIIENGDVFREVLRLSHVPFTHIPDEKTRSQFCG